MSYLTRMLAASSATSFTTPAYDQAVHLSATASGVPVSAQTALKISTVWACVRLIAETIASLPLVVYQRRADGGRSEATNHPLFDLLHDQPNRYQTAFEFREMMTGHALLRGNAYAKIEPGPRGFADQLIPLHPDRVIVEQLKSPDAAPRYRYKVEGLGTFNDTDILHLRGLSGDGITGIDPITYARESFGLTLAGERYGARFFRNDARPSVVLKHPKELKGEAAKRLAASWNQNHGGENIHGTAVLEEGMDLVTVGVEPRNAQFLELREFQAEDACRWFRVPPHMVGLTSKATTWGSGIEQMSIGFVVYTLLPWLKRWEQAISRDLILVPQTYFVEHIVTALLRGDAKARYETYEIARRTGIMNPNEARALENMNPRTDPGGNAFDGSDGAMAAAGSVAAPGAAAGAQPTADDETALKTKAVGELVRAGFKQQDAAKAVGLPSMDDWGLPPVTVQPREKVAPSAPPLKDVGSHYQELLREAAGRVVRKEIAALSRAAKRAGSDWPAVVDEFYADHATFVAQTLSISADMAERYVAEQVAELTARGPEALADWESRRVADLVALVLEAQ